MAIYRYKPINRGFTRTNFEKQNLRGFTLIELLVVFSVIVMLSVVGVAAFVDYSRTQTVQSAANELATMLQTAKSKAQSQVVLDGSGNNLCPSDSPVFIGYEVKLCISGSTCENRKNDNYELNIVCSSTSGNNGSVYRDSKKFPVDVSFDITNTSATSFLFYALRGGINNNGTITVTGYGKERKILIDSAGNISSSAN